MNSSARLRRLRQVARWLRSPEERQDSRHERRRARGGAPELPPGEIRRILFVCKGNICRSPFADVLMAKARPDLEIRSAGFDAGEGSPAQPGALRVAPKFAVSLEDHAAHKLGADDWRWADLVLVMQGRHLARIEREWSDGVAATRLLGDFLPVGPFGIRDPWGQSDEVFEDVFAQIASAVSALDARVPRQSAATMPEPRRGGE